MSESSDELSYELLTKPDIRASEIIGLQDPGIEILSAGKKACVLLALDERRHARLAILMLCALVD